MKNLFFSLITLSCFLLVSCDVQERIVFDKNMGGTYESSFDMSTMLKMAGQNRPTNAEKKMKKMDTTFFFNDILEQHKDSISKLSTEEQEKLQRLRNMTMQMTMDEANEVFKFSAEKTFSSFPEIEFVSYDMDEVFNMAKDQGGAKDAGPAGDMLKVDKVRYTFKNNTFRRVDPKLLKEETQDIDVVETEEENDGNEMAKAMLGEMEDLMKESKMTLTYTFPKKVKSVSHEGATISKDGKTVTYQVDWNTLMNDKGILENFEVVLED